MQQADFGGIVFFPAGISYVFSEVRKGSDCLSAADLLNLTGMWIRLVSCIPVFLR